MALDGSLKNGGQMSSYSEHCNVVIQIYGNQQLKNGSVKCYYRVVQCRRVRICDSVPSPLSTSYKHVKERSYHGPRLAKTCLRAYADSEGRDQPAHLRSLIPAFTVR